jgi:hypothetical protein
VVVHWFDSNLILRSFLQGRTCCSPRQMTTFFDILKENTRKEIKIYR